MEFYADAPDELKNVPTGMETDPEADEQVIDQTERGSRQTGLTSPEGETKTEGTDDDLANALAQAIDGSGTGMAGAPPVAPTIGSVQKLKTEGATGASDTEE